MNPGEFDVFRDLLCEETGIRVRDNRIDYLEYRIQERMLVKGIRDYREYYYMLKYDSPSNSELQELINLVTVHETCFFRHSEQLETLKRVVLKKAVQKKKKRPDFRLRIWSAACSTGEEPLTLAMIIRENFPDLSNRSVSILATDISTRALERARRGVYSENSFRAPLENIRMKYFNKVDGHYHAGNDIRSMVTYRQANLSDLDSLDIYQGMDVILCRNVFIYFPDEIKDGVARKFYDLLSRGGALILGNAESIDVKKIPFKLEFHKGGPVYFKP